MLLLLAVSLLLAMAFTAHAPALPDLTMQGQHLMTIGHLQFTLPAGWTPKPINANGPLGNAGLTLTNDQNPQKTLTIGLIPDMRMRSPQIALEQATDLLLSGQEYQPLIQTRIRQGTAAGYLQVELTGPASAKQSRIPTAADSKGVINHVLVYSHDAREYVVILHAEHINLDDNLLKRTQQRLTSAMQLILAIARESQSTEFQLATDKDMAQAGLSDRSRATRPSNTVDSPVIPDAQWMFFAKAAPQDNDALHLLPFNGSPAFWTAALRGAVAPDTSKDQSLTGDKLLALIQKQASDDPSKQGRIVPMNNLAIRGWKLISDAKPSHKPDDKTSSSTMPDDDSDDATTQPLIHSLKASEERRPDGDGLVRELWYVPTSDQHVIVAQLIAEPEALNEAASALTKAISTILAAQLKTPPPSADNDNWSQALERGQKIATTVNHNVLANQRVGFDYSVLRMESSPIGFAISQSIKGDEPLPVRGRDVMYILAQNPIVQDSSWSSDAHLTRMWRSSSTHQLTAAAEPEPSAKRIVEKRLEMRDGYLSNFDVQGSSTTVKKLWSQKTPANYLSSLGLDHLSPEHLKAWSNQPPAVVMFATGDWQPEPCWLEVRAFNNRWRMTIRRMADVACKTLWYDATGSMVHYAWSQCYPHYGGPVNYSTSQSDRDTIINAFDKLRPQIIAWEKEWQVHD